MKKGSGSGDCVEVPQDKMAVFMLSNLVCQIGVRGKEDMNNSFSYSENTWANDLRESRIHKGWLLITTK